MIARRLLAFNLLVLFLPGAALFYLDVYESQLLRELERSMVQQGRLVAAAASGSSAIDASAAAAILRRLDDSDARLRLYDGSGALVADSNRLRVAHTSTPAASEYEAVLPGIRGRMLYRIGALVVAMRPRRSTVTTAGADQPAQTVRTALAGKYGAATRPTPGQRSMTLFSGVPIRSDSGEIIGAVLVSQTTFRALQALYAVRLRVFEIVVVSMLVAVALTAIAAATVVQPLARLRREASDIAARRTRLPGRFADVTRRDEVGDLARSLQELTARLDEHIRTVEQFASDVSHEFRNPLASIRSAAEMASVAPTGEERDRFLQMLTRDVDRLERLVSGVRQLALIDAEVEQQPLDAIDVGALLGQLVAGVRLADPACAQILLSLDPRPAIVRATADRLVQVFENVLGNAISFAPRGTTVDVTLDRTDDRCCRITVADRGPGIPSAHLARVFDRFFSYRPDSLADRTHTGLGLSIARTIVHGFGGAITAENRCGGGSCFVIKLPLLMGAGPERYNRTGADGAARRL
ncbi:MAG TPA: ATP-binding protein [Vicinamibacterales bacterium]|nr:ATP-binding protein [Vicinamibacterales bacterium]